MFLTFYCKKWALNYAKESGLTEQITFSYYDSSHDAFMVGLTHKDNEELVLRACKEAELI